MARAEALVRRPDLAVNEGDISDMLMAGGAAMGDRVIGYGADRFRATFVDGARGEDLDTLADDHWGIQRLAASKASCTVTITRSGATAFPATYPVGTIVATARDAQGNEVRFLTTQAATWLASVNGDRTVNAEAEVAGADGNVLVNTLTRIVSDSPGFGSYAATANTAAAGGDEEETDAALRDRLRNYPATIRRGTIAALEYGARQVTGVTRASAVEDDTGLVTVYVSDSSGLSSGVDTTSAATVVDDGTMTKKVAIELHSWRAAGSLVNVVGGTLQTVDITVALTVRLGVNVAELVAAVETAIETAVNRLRIGETLYKSAIQMAARSVDPDNIMECTVSEPLTDTAPTGDGYIIRAGTITVA